MTLPSKASINTYAGALQDAVPIVDPTSEVSAAAMNALQNDVSAMTSTASIAMFLFSTGASGTVPVIATSSTWTTGYDSVWGNAALYMPALSRTSTGLYLVTFPASVPDQLGSMIPVNIRFAEANRVNGSAVTPANCLVLTSNTFNIQTFSGGSLSDLNNATFAVQVY